MESVNVLSSILSQKQNDEQKFNKFLSKTINEPIKFGEFARNPLHFLGEEGLSIESFPFTTSTSTDFAIITHWWGVDFIMSEQLTSEIIKKSQNVSTFAAAIAPAFNGSSLGDATQIIIEALAAAFFAKSVEVDLMDKGMGVHWPVTWLQWALVLAALPFGPGGIVGSFLAFVHPFGNKIYNKEVKFNEQINKVEFLPDWQITNTNLITNRGVSQSVGILNYNNLIVVIGLNSIFDLEVFCIPPSGSGIRTPVAGPMPNYPINDPDFIISMGCVVIDFNIVVFCCNTTTGDVYQGTITLSSNNSASISWTTPTSIPDEGVITASLGLDYTNPPNPLFLLSDNAGSLWSLEIQTDTGSAWNYNWSNIGLPRNDVSIIESLGLFSDFNIATSPSWGVFLKTNEGHVWFYGPVGSTQAWFDLGAPGDNIKINISLGVGWDYGNPIMLCWGNDGNLYGCMYTVSLGQFYWYQLGRPNDSNGDVCTIVGKMGVQNNLGNQPMVLAIGDDGYIWSSVDNSISWSWTNNVIQNCNNVNLVLYMGTIAVNNSFQQFAMGSDTFLYKIEQIVV